MISKKGRYLLQNIGRQDYFLKKNEDEKKRVFRKKRRGGKGQAEVGKIIYLGWWDVWSKAREE